MRKVLYILGDLTEADIGWMAKTGNVEMLTNNHCLVSAGEMVEQLHIILEGKLNVIVGKGNIVAELLAGDMVGEMSLIEKRPAEVLVQASEKTKVLSIAMTDLREKLENDIGFSARFYRALSVLLSDRLRETTAKLNKGDQPKTSFEGGGEIDEALLDTLHVAGDRMRRLLAMLEGKRTT